MTKEEIADLFGYDKWATDRTLEAMSSVPSEVYLRDLHSSHGGIHGTLVHIYGASLAWLRRWKGVSRAALTPVTETRDLPTLKAAWGRYYEELQEYLAGVEDSTMARSLAYTDLRGNPHAEPLYQQMQHVANHASYHRGQLVTMMRQVDAKPVSTDLIAFYREKQGRG